MSGVRSGLHPSQRGNLTSMRMDRLREQIEFVVEVDGLKKVLRRTRPIGMERLENSAEHSWQIVLMAITLAEHSNGPVDVLKVVKMLAIHDVVEIDVGDTFHYDKPAELDLPERELAAARRIFGMLPSDQEAEFLALWQEFEARETAEAKFAASVDRVVAFLMNRGNGFGTWSEHGIAPELVLERNAHIAEGSAAIWELAKEIICEYQESLNHPVPQ